MSQGQNFTEPERTSVPMAPEVSLDPGCGVLPARIERLKTRPQFQTVLAGKLLAKTSHFALHRAAPLPVSLFAQQCIWLGAMVPKRWARRAVTRNAIRRQIYTVSLLYTARLDMAAHVIRLRSSFDTKQYVSAASDALKRAVRAELQNLLDHACSAAAVRVPGG